jgi:PAS domain S-box-containing protein
MFLTNVSSRLLPRILLRVVPLAALVLIAVWYGTSRYITSTVQAELVEKLNREAEHGAAEMASRLGSLLSALQGVASNDLVVNSIIDYEARNAYIATLIQSLRLPGPAGALITMTDYRGRPIASNVASPHASDYFVVGNASSGAFMRLDQWELVVAVPILISDRAEGAIIAKYGPESFAELLHFDTSSELTAVLSGEEVLFASGWPTGTTPMVGDNALTEGYFTASAAAPGLPSVRVVVAMPTATAFAAVNRLNNVMLLAIVVAIAALGSGIARAAFLATQPLNRFNSQIDEIGNASDLNTRVDTAGTLEFRLLANSFNSMLERLQTTIASRDALKGHVEALGEMERELRSSEARYRHLIEGSVRGIYICRNDDILFANQAFANTFALSDPIDIVGKVKLSELLDDASCAELQRLSNIPESADTEGVQSEFCRRDDADVEQWYENVMRPIHWEGERAVEGSLFDISDRKRIERMKSEFVSVVSHELRTPLTSLVGSLGLIRTGKLGALPEKVDPLVRIAHVNSERLVALVNDILDIEKIESGHLDFQPVPVAIGDLCAQVLSETAFYGAKHGVTLDMQVGPEDAYVMADRDRLIQVLTNLLSNAAKFSPEGEKVVLDVEHTNGNVRFSVIDRGEGIPPALQDRVFKKFFQADGSDNRKTPGTGLGLSISKAIVEGHGGTIDFHSVSGEGTTFYFELPEHHPAKGADERPSAMVYPSQEVA